MQFGLPGGVLGATVECLNDGRKSDLAPPCDFAEIEFKDVDVYIYMYFGLYFIPDKMGLRANHHNRRVSADYQL